MIYDKPDYTLTDTVVAGVTTLVIAWKPTSNYPGRTEKIVATSRFDAIGAAMYLYGVALVP